MNSTQYIFIYSFSAFHTMLTERNMWNIIKYHKITLEYHLVKDSEPPNNKADNFRSVFMVHKINLKVQYLWNETPN